jgi:ribonuclease HI
MAAIEGLGALKRRCACSCTPIRSTCCRARPNGCRNWKARGWRTAARAPVKNQDLWERLDAALAAQDIEWHWVKGHSGHDGNEFVDALANLAIDRLLSGK